MTIGVLPAIDALVALGIADDHRVGVFGQSFGGFAVDALLAQTDRFKAGVSISGVTDWTALHAGFDSAWSGWGDLAKDKSANAILVERAIRFGTPPFEDPELYFQNSPISHVKEIDTPLLLAHGSMDIRAGVQQAQQFFTEMYRQGKTARLVTYEGEGHSISNSPANVRNLFDEIISWFDTYLNSFADARSFRNDISLAASRSRSARARRVNSTQVTTGNSRATTAR
nr:prolyl oligopeptidase family serine peptidase [Qipengyuania aestuarii]